MFDPCPVKCAVCGKDIDYHKRYGADVPCCGKECYFEFNKRYAESLFPKPKGWS